MNILSNTPKIIYKPIYASTWAKYFLATDQLLLTLKWITESIKRDPLNDQDLFLLAKLFLRSREYEKAKDILGKAIDLDPKNWDYLVTYADILYELDGAETAIGYIRDALKTNDANAQLLGRISIYYYKSGQAKKFELYKKEVEKLVNRDEHFYHFLISASKLEGRSDKVVEYGMELLKINPGDLEVRMLIGEILFENKKLEDAEKIFNSVKVRLPAYPKIHYFLAQIYIVRQDYDKAVEMGLEEIKYKPNLSQGHYIVGEIYRLQGKYIASIKNLKRAIQIDRNNYKALVSLGWIKIRQNYLEQAREFYIRAREANPGDPQIYKQLGLIYQGTGQSALAIESLKIYLDLNPGAKDKQTILNMMRKLL